MKFERISLTSKLQLINPPIHTNMDHKFQLDPPLNSSYTPKSNNGSLCVMTCSAKMCSSISLLNHNETDPSVNLF